MPRLVKKKGTQEETQPDFLVNTLKIAALAAERKAGDIKAYDVHELTVVADIFVLCSATSEPQLRAIFNEVRDGMKQVGVAPLHSEGTFSGGWMVIDYGSVIFHLFRKEAREYYDLDGLWGDAPQVELDLDGK